MTGTPASGRGVDLVVCGAGLAGMVAATRAAELGIRTVLLEAGDDDGYACNSRLAGGVLHVAYQDVTRGREFLTQAMNELTGGEAKPELVDAVAADAERVLAWLREQGVRILKFGNTSLGSWVLAPPRRLVTHLEWKGYGPDVALRTLAERFKGRGGAIEARTRAVELLMEDGRCVGVRAVRDGVAIDHRGRGVVIADGGFAGDADLFREHIGPQPSRVVQRGAGTGRGDGLRMALAVGAASSNLRPFYGHLLSRDALRNDRLWPYPQLDFVATAGIIVDRQGRRIFDEGRGGIYAANMLARRDDPTDAYVVLDRAIWEGPGARDGMIPANPKVEAMGGTVHRGDTVIALAAKAGILADALERTVADYNAALRDGRLDTLEPARSERKARAWPLEGPFLAIPACAGITYTTGGIVIDAGSNVLDRNRRRICGLYAAGAATGGLEGGELASYIGGLVKAAVQGLRAAESFAAA